MASRTFDMAPAWDPGEPEGTEIGEAPIGGCPESEGGIMFGKGESLASRTTELLPATALVLTTSHFGTSMLAGTGLYPTARLVKAFYLRPPFLSNSGCS